MRYLIAFIAITGLYLSAGQSAIAKDQPYLSQLQGQSQGVSKSEAAAIAQQQFGGKVLKVQKQNRQGQSVWRVKLLQSTGHVKQVWIDPRTGKPL